MNKLYLFIFLLIIVIILFLLLIWYCIMNYINIYTKKPIKRNNMWKYIDKLETGDLFITGTLKGKNKFEAGHVGMIVRFNGKCCLLESINIDRCRQNKSVIDDNYQTGPKLYYLEDELKLSNEVRKRKKCYDTLLIRKLNYDKLKMTPEELKKKIMSELKIFRDSNSRFEKKYNLYPFAILGSLFWYIPNGGMSNIANIFPTSYNNDGYFCSEFIPLLMQRLGLLDYKYNARIFWPQFLTDNFDYLEKGLYHQDLFFYY